MVNEHKQVICDYCNNILNDGVTVLPGHLSIHQGKALIHISEDPNNRYDLPGPDGPRLDLLRNRVEYQRAYPADEIFEIDGDFCSHYCINSKIALLNKKELEDIEE